MEFDVRIEIPRGSRNKYEVDHAGRAAAEAEVEASRHRLQVAQAAGDG